MLNEICWYEERAQEIGEEFFSIKNNGQSTLVFNPNLIDKGLGTKPFTFQNGKALRNICSQCHFCRPFIDERFDGFRIIRYGYNTPQRDKPLAEFTYLPAKGEIRGIKVAEVDDFNLTQLVSYLSEVGFELMCVTVNPNVPTSEIKSRQLYRTIIEWGPDWLLSDKGLGFVDGIELIRTCKEAGIRTMMITGEVQTAATRRVADYFIEKPVSMENLIAILETPQALE